MADNTITSSRISWLREICAPLEDGPEPTECAVCEESMETGDGLEPTRICNACAQNIVLDDLPLLLDRIVQLEQRVSTHASKHKVGCALRCGGVISKKGLYCLGGHQSHARCTCGALAADKPKGNK